MTHKGSPGGGEEVAERAFRGDAAVATVSNPGRADITRAVETKVAATVTNGAGGSGSLWDYSYSKSTACFDLANNAEFNQPLRIDGDMCMSNNSALPGQRST